MLLSFFHCCKKKQKNLVLETRSKFFVHLLNDANSATPQTVHHFTQISLQILRTLIPMTGFFAILLEKVFGTNISYKKY